MPDVERRLPSGLSGIIGGWKTKDLGIFADRAAIKRPGPFIESRLLRKAWRETTDPGIYDFNGRPPWMGEVLQGDQIDALKHARIQTFGVDVDEDFRCKNAICGEVIPWTFPLDKLPVKELNDEAKGYLMEGNRIPWTLPWDGKSIVYSLPTGRTLVLADKLARQHGRRMEVVLASRIVSIDGVSKGKVVEYLGDLDPLCTAELQEELDRLNCGLDTEIEIVCKECGDEQTHDYMMGQSFFLPHLGKTKRKTTTENGETENETG